MAEGTLRRIVIVGHGIAGLTSGDTLRAEGFDGELLIVGQESYDPYSRPALSKAMLSGMSADERTDVQPQYLAAPSDGAQVIAGCSAVGLDTASRTVLLDDGTRLTYDGLVIASGARARRFTDSPDEIALRDLDDARILRRRLAGRPHVTVVGGGPLGMEIASGAREAGCEVTLIHRGRPMERHLGPYLAGLCETAARDHGVQLIDSAVSAVPSVGPGGGLELELDNGQIRFAELLVSAIGDEPQAEWLAGSELLAGGRLVADDWGFVSADLPDVVAAGDVAWRLAGTVPRRRALWTDAIEQAKVAARALLHGRSTPPASYSPYFWTEQFGLNLRICGEIPGDEIPVVTDGDPAELRALFRWAAADGTGAAASLNYRIPIPKLRRLALAEAVGV